MNWALKLEAYSSRCAHGTPPCTLRWRPKTFTSSWPVKASSTVTVELPVVATGGRTAVWDRLAIGDRDDAWTTAPSPEATGQDGRDVDHHRENADDRQQGGEQLTQRLLQGLATVVDVVVTAEQLASRLVSK
jgi:hypothetical protein